MRIFGSIEQQTESTFPFLYIIIFQRWESFEHPSSIQGKIDICAHGLVCTKFNFEQLLLKAIFNVMHIFGCIEPFSSHFDLICLDDLPNTLF